MMNNQIVYDIARLYGINSEELISYPHHAGGRNMVYRHGDMIIRVSDTGDRIYEDYLAEAEYVRYLAENGADCVNVIFSLNGSAVVRVGDAFVTAFTLAKGDQLADHGYRYRDGAPLSEYFYNTGKTLGKIHALSKNYHPTNRRFDFFEKYSEVYFNELIPDGYTELKKALAALLGELRRLPRANGNYGMVHFDFSDGNYNIDYGNGRLTVFDFENCRTCFYLFDLANLWTHGVGWVADESDTEKRKAFMDEYFKTILDGYRSETELTDDELSRLPLMIQTVLMENIVDEFEVQKAETGRFENDEEQAYRIKCLTDGIEYMGFFDEIYNSEHPFEVESFLSSRF